MVRANSGLDSMCSNQATFFKLAAAKQNYSHVMAIGILNTIVSFFGNISDIVPIEPFVVNLGMIWQT